MNYDFRILLAVGLTASIAFAILFVTISGSMFIIPAGNPEIESSPEIRHEGMKLEGVQPTVVVGSITLDNPGFGLENRDCFFSIEPSDLDGKFSTQLSDRIRQAGDLNSADVSVDLSGGGWFAGKGTIEPTEAIEMIKEFNFKFHLDMLEKIIRHNENVVFESRWYSCNLEFKDRVYDVTFVLSVPVEITGTSGIVSVFITPDSLAEKPSLNKGKTVYDPFNNTIVWINKLDSWVTVDVNYTDVFEKDANGVVTVGSDSKKIPPGGLLDMYLSPNWYKEHPSESSRTEDRIYSYKISEYAGISDTIAVSAKYSHQETDGCYSMEEAKSLYSQSKLDVRFPSYIPEGFAPVCYRTGSSGWFIQVYSNITKDFGSFVGNPNDSFMIGIQPKNIITIHSGEDPILRLNSTAYERYQKMIANSVLPADAKFLVLDGMSVMAYVQNDVAAADIFPNDEAYHHIQGKVPLGELVKMAKSLYEEEPG